MRVQQCAFHLGILFAFLAEIRAFSMEEKCKFWAGKGYIGDPSDCQAWGYCQNNKLIEQRTCTEGLLYNFRDGTCKPASEAMCHSHLSEICSELEPGDLVADPANCRRFVECDNINNPIWSYCAEGQVFSNKHQKCLEEISGCPQDNICSYMVDGSFVGDSKTCRNYFKCYNGFGIQLNCSSGRYFNRKTGKCQSWRPNYCHNDEETPLVTPLASDFHMCSKYYQEDRSGVQLISDLLTCYGYYTCTSRFDKGQWSSCPWGQHFEWWSQRCGSPKDNSCSYDRCGNVNQVKMTAINTGCREYTICQGYRSIKSQECPEDFPYFNEITQHCTDEFPNHRVCYMDG
uniref:Peritrophin-44 n=1 Tax=Drosophila rhopaloa TaxID=1041015 RepID=A0A6P4FLE2_DRORH